MIKVIKISFLFLIINFNVNVENIDRLIGLEKPYAIHLNDSKGAFGSRIDRIISEKVR